VSTDGLGANAIGMNQGADRASRRTQIVHDDAGLDDCRYEMPRKCSIRASFMLIHYPDVPVTVEAGP